MSVYLCNLCNLCQERQTSTRTRVNWRFSILDADDTDRTDSIDDAPRKSGVRLPPWSPFVASRVDATPRIPHDVWLYAAIWLTSAPACAPSLDIALHKNTRIRPRVATSSATSTFNISLLTILMLCIQRVVSPLGSLVRLFTKRVTCIFTEPWGVASAIRMSIDAPSALGNTVRFRAPKPNNHGPRSSMHGGIPTCNGLSTKDFRPRISFIHFGVCMA